MRNLFALIGFVVVMFLGAGWYLGWYTFAWGTGSDGRTKVALDVDNGKVIGDIKKGGQRVGDFIDGLKSGPSAEKAAKQAADPTFVGPPVPAEWVPPGTPKIAPAAGLPGPIGVKK